MLTLTRRRGEAIHCGGEILLRVVRITPTRVELAIDCPRTMPIVRGEVREGWELTPQAAAALPAG